MVQDGEWRKKVGGESNRKQETLGLDTRNHFKTTIYGFLLLTFWQAKFFATIQVLIRKAGIMEFSHNLSLLDFIFR